MKTYKVWLHIEEIDEEADSYTDVDEPHSVGEFDSLAEAETMRDDVEAYGERVWGYKR